MKYHLIKLIIIISLLSGCTVMSNQRELDSRLSEPTKLESIPFLEIERMGFLQAGWECADRMGWPKWVHPTFVQIFGCADVRILHGKVVSCDVIASSEYALKHELRHCEGYDD